MKAKRSYKDSLFRHIFNDKARLASLYKGLTGREIDTKDITITTLKGVFFNDIKNDISFRIGNRDIILMEHQSSWNPNMALRMLWYIAKIYSRQIGRDIVYRSQMVEIPAPEFYVLYNGHQEELAYQKLRLSDAFAHETDTLELVVDCYNINYSEHSELLNQCYELRCYSIFVQKTRDYYAESHDLTRAVRLAIAYCKTHDLMADYFAENEKEVFDMVNFKWDQKRALEIAKEDGVAEGLEKGIEKGRAEGRADKKRAILGIALSLLRKGMSVNFIAETTQLSVEEVQKLARDNGLAF
ncbi:transposase [Mitsuokella sp.]|uniref:transposase n=1 Tax=Mitsuokella sp. TaxID=2049034 RepID=UPI003D7E9CDA